jgi:hypothetical protein
MKIYILLLLTFLSFAFAPYKNEALIGSWVYSHQENDMVFYKKKNHPGKHKPGIEFKNDGKIINRKNGSWCGTGPVKYTDYEGTWEKRTDSTVTLIYQYNGQMCQEEWQVSSLKKGKMAIKRLSYQLFEKISVERDRLR